MPLELHGFKYSVYAWIARFALREKGVDYAWVEVNPFAEDVPAAYLALHPFCRVPTLVDGDFVLYETGAITRYLDDKFDGLALQPAAPEARARVSQILSIVDSYVYWPLVRQVFSHGVFAARMGEPADRAEYENGLAAAPRVLDALDRLAGGSDFLVGDTLTLADIHLAPMMSYFTTDDGGMALLAQRQRLNTWWTAISARPAFIETRPRFPEPRA